MIEVLTVVLSNVGSESAYCSSNDFDNDIGNGSDRPLVVLPKWKWQ